MNNKKIKLTLLVVLAAMSVAGADEVEITKKWFELSKFSQNIGGSLEMAKHTGRPDPEPYKEGIKNVDLTLQYLVRKKVLVEKKIRINISLDDEENESYNKLRKFVSSLTNDYGLYTAMEMCDFGVKSQLNNFGKGEDYTLKVRLPKDRMVKFMQLVKPLPVYLGTIE